MPGVGIALLSLAIFLNEMSMGLRNKGAGQAEGFPYLDLVLSGHRIVSVAVRRRSLVADHPLMPTEAAFAGVGLASFSGMTVVDIVPGTTTKAVAVLEEVAGQTQIKNLETDVAAEAHVNKVGRREDAKGIHRSLKLGLRPLPIV